MRAIIYLSHHEKSITGGHKYNDAFVVEFMKLTGIKVRSTPECAQKYRSWRKILSPFAELKYLRLFSKDTLVMFGDTRFKYHFLLALLNKWITKAKSTMIVHHFPFISGSGLVWRINKWLMCKYTSLMDSIIVPSPFTFDMAKTLFPNKKIFYVPLAFEHKFKRSLNYEVGNLLYVGTIEERKGLSYLIDAISMLENRESVKLNIVGKVVEQSYYEKLQQQISSLGLSENVHFLGRISDETLAECYQKAEIFTFPSLLEGYGIVLIEAFNNGLPIICFDNTALPYTVKDGVNGFVARNKDSRDMASKIQLLMGNAPLREKLQVGIEDTVMHLKTQKDFEKSVEILYQYINI
ncbi:MAG: glycosyltransferase family 4 protein [Mediterranea massiliensis]|nr:glycosyltransferase family 4 protein [Mediterranea massiliensis]